MLKLPETMAPPCDPTYAGLGHPVRLLPPPKIIEVTAADCYETAPIDKIDERIYRRGIRALSVREHGFITRDPDQYEPEILAEPRKEPAGGIQAFYDSLQTKPDLNPHDHTASAILALQEATQRRRHARMERLYDRYPGLGPVRISD